MAFTQFKHSGTLNPEISVCEKKHSSFAEKAAEEGIVLLKNENILPISLSASVALLGIGADKTVKGGIGSGDVNNRQNITIYEGMEESGIRITRGLLTFPASSFTTIMISFAPSGSPLSVSVSVPARTSRPSFEVSGF